MQNTLGMYRRDELTRKAIKWNRS